MIKTLLLILLTVTFRNASGQQNDIKELTTINQNWLNSYPKKIQRPCLKFLQKILS
jgi:hypothetical protein